ncbi:MAG TPA: hypothetical protein VG621_01105 [Candidatus Paceibacterota bacterium]|nr:hypothetical protein [Candidatus Paceibacterota bacterium]
MKKFIISIAVLAFASVMTVSTAPAHAGGTCTVMSFTASPSTVSSGGTSTVSWTTSGCDTVSITPSQNPDNRPPSSSVSTGALTQTTTFTIVGHTDYGGVSSPQSVTITVSGSGSGGGGTSGGTCQPTSFTAQEYTVQAGDSTVLHWDSQNCDTASIVPADYPGDRPPYGSIDTGAIDRSTEYTLTVYDANGNIGGQRFLTINVVGSGQGGNNYCQVSSFSANPSSITQGGYSTLQWNTSGNVSYVTISGLSGNQNASGSITVNPYTTTTYTLNAYCNGGSNQTSSTTVYVTNNGGGYYGSAPQAITTVATVLNGTEAQLNGIAIPNTTYGTTNAWFEWGIGTSLGNRTATQFVSSGNSSQYYNSLIAGLAPGATYSYRAVVQNANGTAYGSVVTFRTTTPPPQVAVHTTTTTTAHTVVVAQSAPSSLKLSVDSSADHMCIDGEIDYTITYQNISKQVLKDAVLQFTLPKEVTYLQSSGGNYSVEDRTITIPLDAIEAGEQGVITVRGMVNSSAANGSLTVATATIVYTDVKTHAQEDATAYALVTATNGCPVVGGSVFGVGSFLPTTLLGWLLLILVIFGLIVLGRQLRKKSDQK